MSEASGGYPPLVTSTLVNSGYLLHTEPYKYIARECFRFKRKPSTLLKGGANILSLCVALLKQRLHHEKCVRTFFYSRVE